MNDMDPCEFTYQEYPGTPYPTIITACPQSDEYVAACQNWREGHFGIIDPQPVVTQAASGMAVVEAFPGSRQPNAAPNGRLFLCFGWTNSHIHFSRLIWCQCEQCEPK